VARDLWTFEISAEKKNEPLQSVGNVGSIGSLRSTGNVAH
jgi:hypothetical protein